MRKSVDEKPLLITVRNDIEDSGTRYYHKSQHDGKNEYGSRGRSRDDELRVGDRESEDKQQGSKSNDESSDVDSDYTIEMRSHQGSDDAKSDDDDDSVYSVEFKNIGGSDEEGDDCVKGAESKEANEDEVGEGIFEESEVKEDSFQALAVESKDIDTAKNDAASSEYSDGEGETDQERTVIVRKSGTSNVTSIESAPLDIVNKDNSSGKESAVEDGTGSVSMLSVNEESDLAGNQGLLKVSEKKPVDKVVREIEIKHDDSKRTTKGISKTSDNKVSPVDDKGLVGEVGRHKKDIASDRKVNRNGDGKIMSKGVVREEDRMKSKMSKEKKLLEEIKFLEEKLGKEHAKTTPEKEAVVDNFERKGTLKSDGSKGQSSKSEKVIGQGVTSGKECIVEGEKRNENKGLVSSKNVQVEKPNEGSLIRRNVETIDRNLSGRSPGGKSAFLKEAADKVIKKQAVDCTDAVRDTQTTEKKSKLEIKDANVKVILDEKQANHATDNKRKSKSTDAKARTPSNKKNQDTMDKSKIQDYSKKSQKVKAKTKHRSVSASSGSTESNTGSSSSSSSSDQSDSDSASESETDSSKSGSHSAKSGSEKSSDSVSDSSSDSSQSSLSDSESSSSEEENFKRRRRKSSEPKAVRRDARQRQSNPRKEKEAGYISPLRTKRSEWGTKRHEEKNRQSKTDERFRKKPERQERGQSYSRSRGYSKDRPRQHTRSGSRGRSQGHSQRRTRSRDRTDSKTHKASIDFTEKRPMADSKDRTNAAISKDPRDRTDARAHRNSRDRTDTKARKNSRDRTDTRARRDSRDRTDPRGRRDSRDRTDTRARKDSRDRADKRPHKDSRDHMDTRPRKNSRDRTNTRARRNSRDRTDTRARKDSRDRTDTRARKDSRDRTDTRTHMNSRDRTDIRGRRNSRDRMYSRNRKDLPNRMKEGRYLGDGKQNSESLQSKNDTLDDRKGAAYRKRPEDRDKERESKTNVSGKEAQDNPDSLPKNEHLEKPNAKSDLSTQKGRNPLEKTGEKDAVKSKQVAEKEKSLSHGKPGSRDSEKKSDFGKVVSSSDPSTISSLVTDESKNPKSLMELDIHGAKVDAGKVSSRLASESQSKVSRQKQAGRNKVNKLKRRIEDEPKPLMEITLSAVVQPTGEPDNRQLRKVSMSGPSDSRAVEESKHVETKHRHVLRVGRRPSMDAELSYKKGDNQPRDSITNGATKRRSSEIKTPKSRLYLKRLSSGKEVYLENKDIEPLMKPVDFDIEVLKKPRIVENISDESEDHGSIRRVISNSSSDVPQIQITSDGMFELSVLFTFWHVFISTYILFCKITFYENI